MQNHSIVCAIGNKESDKMCAIQEAEKFAQQIGLGKREALHMRLITEELMGMLQGLVYVDDGEFWIDKDREGGCVYHLQVSATVAEKAREIFLGASTENMNRAYNGFTGVIRKAIDNMFDGADPYSTQNTSGVDRSISMHPDVQYSSMACEWSYKYYREQQKKNEQAENWDALELSVLKNLADDIIVSVRPRRIEITIKTGG